MPVLIANWACVDISFPRSQVKDLNAKVRQFITGWNDHKNPFIWTNNADDILKNANHQPTSETRH